MSVISRASRVLGMDESTLEKESLRTFLRKKIREYEAEMIEIHRKYGVRSAREFEKLYELGKLSEEETLDDFFKLDYLESQVEKIKALLRELGD